MEQIGRSQHGTSPRRPGHHGRMWPAVLVFLSLAATPRPGVALEVESWRLVESPHFALYTDAEPERGAEIVLGLERFRAVFARLSPSLELRSPTPTTLFAFRDAEVYGAYKASGESSGARILGQFVTLPDASYITLDAGALQRGALGVIQHEYVHHFVRHNFPRVPLWFNEGLAEYYSTFSVDGDRARIGRPVEEHLRRLRAGELDLRQVLEQGARQAGAGHDAVRLGDFYATSWGLVHYLLASGERLDQTADFLLRLHQGEDPEEAFEESFGGRVSGFEKAMVEYLGGELAEVSVPVVRLKAPEEVRIRSLAPADTLYRLGDLLAHIGRLEAAEKHFQRALDHHPDHPDTLAGLAWVRDAQGRHDEAAWLHREAHDAGARSPLHLLAYGRHLLIVAGQPTEADEEPAARVDDAIRLLQQAIDVDPDYGEAHALLAQAHLLRADPGDGVRHAQRARALLPARDELVLLEVDLLMRAGQLDAAAELVEAELAFRAPPEVVDRVRLELERWRLLQRAQEAFDRGDSDEGLELFDRAITATTDPRMRRRMEEQLESWQQRLDR